MPLLSGPAQTQNPESPHWMAQALAEKSPEPGTLHLRKLASGSLDAQAQLGTALLTSCQHSSLPPIPVRAHEHLFVKNPEPTRRYTAQKKGLQYDLMLPHGSLGDAGFGEVSGDAGFGVNLSQFSRFPARPSEECRGLNEYLYCFGGSLL